MDQDLAYFEAKASTTGKIPDLKFSDEKFRTQENAISNLIADIVLTEPAYEMTDFVFVNGGNFRGDGQWEGFIKTEQLYTLLAIKDRFVQLKVLGSVIKQVLENSVSDSTIKDEKNENEEED